MKKLLGLVLSSILGLSFVGCSSTKEAETITTESGFVLPAEIGVGKVLEAHENDGVIVIKTQIMSLSGSSDFDFKMFTQQFDDVANGVDLTNVKEVQIWTLDKHDIKTYSATMSREHLIDMKNGTLYWNKVDDMKLMLQDLYTRN